MSENNMISLWTGDGREMKFEQVAGIRLGSRRFAVLAPVEKLPGMQDNQALVCEITKGEGEDARLNIVTDPALVEAVFQEYQAVMAQKMEDQARAKPEFF